MSGRHRPVGVSLSEEVLDRIDRIRGFASRSVVIENLLRDRLGMPIPPPRGIKKASPKEEE